MGPLGETAGKNGRPELSAVAPVTLQDLVDTVAWMTGAEPNIHVRREGGKYHVVLGSGSKFASGTADTLDAAVSIALSYLGARL